jgi:phosphoribosyl-ATP pyrophosphohydrolase/phosphoribosyl-AMP cyclohydrolase
MSQPEPLTDRRISHPAQLDALSFGQDGLLPVVVQDAGTSSLLMVAWANREALERTLASGEMHFWSRSRQELWHKGATSGNTQELVSLHSDCDGDTLLALVNPTGPACHTNEMTCFGDLGPAPSAEVTLPGLWEVLQERARSLPEDSYTARLLKDENLRLKKLGEETAELILALGRGEGERVASEAGDLVYHLLVAMLAAGVTLEELLMELEERRR